jgi:hypothetical protein
VPHPDPQQQQREQQLALAWAQTPFVVLCAVPPSHRKSGKPRSTNTVQNEEILLPCVQAKYSQTN